MKKTFSILLALLLVLSLCAACAKPKEERQDAWAVQGDTVTFTLRDISAGTGYVWAYEITNPEVLECVSDEVLQQGEKPGASATHTFVFRSVAGGATTLVFTQGQPWEGGDQNGDKLTYQVLIDQDGKISVG